MRDKLKGLTTPERDLIIIWEMRQELANKKCKTFDEQVERNAKVCALDDAYIALKKQTDGEQLTFDLQGVEND